MSTLEIPKDTRESFYIYRSNERSTKQNPKAWPSTLHDEQHVVHPSAKSRCSSSTPMNSKPATARAQKRRKQNKNKNKTKNKNKIRKIKQQK